MGRVINVGEEAYKGGSFEPIPVGEKVVATVYAIEEVQVKSGNNAGKPQLDVTFKIQGGQYNGREIRFQKIPLYDGPAAWKLVTFAESVGWPTKPSVTLPDNLQSVLGTPLVVKVGQQEDANKRIWNTVTGFAKLDDSSQVGEPVASQDAAPSWGALNGS
jgi:hypothetical protein